MSEATQARSSAAPLLAGVAVLGVLVTLAVWVFWPQTRYLEGQIEADRVSIASKYPGRIKQLHVREGDTVTQGQLLVEIDSPEADAKMAQVQAMVSGATALRDKAEAGARTQDIARAKAGWQAAVEEARLAQVTYERMQRLHQDGVIPRQRRDEAQTIAAAMAQKVVASRAQYDEALEGARKEDKAAASAQLGQAQGAQAEVEAVLAETRLTTPVAGEVSTRIGEEGEVVGAGFPLLVITRTELSWVTFNLREDFLHGLQVGQEFTARVPALDNREVRFKVSLIAPLGDFATWRSTRDLGSFDLRTFEVRARPVETVEGLRPGMRVVLPESDLHAG
ncbi:efflux RND transporter periplasmic adaptor subunit [Pseudomonas sp. UL073]|uniref:Efflux RND transporter periplasmic adaptor subunit n=1 Tax=Zestomonas insulae TaxID=2809017 RepID=A0ABS2IH09_9GAMM|nr:efflux RND transporter periplasmic adaptor subunit [Pseudomonas insulae]MBM7061963.1 efflux RND transporter periplasmic adaptor subunit [Pseudomonas insulae]